MTPTAFALLFFGALGIGALTSIFDDDDDNAGVDTATPQPPNEGGEGDDVIDHYDPSADEDGTLGTRGGDDLVAVVDLNDVMVDLGAGDDSLEGGNYHDVTITAGEGDDLVTLEGGEEVAIGTGTGNDTVLLTDPGHGLGVDLGEDDDHILITGATPSADYTGSDVRWLTGGEGNDRFEFVLRPNSDGAPFEDPMTMGHPHAAIISDFTSGSDRLIVDPSTLAGDALYTGYEITSAAGTGYLEIVFRYTHPDHPTGLAVSVALVGRGPSGFQESDIEIVGRAV